MKYFDTKAIYLYPLSSNTCILMKIKKKNNNLHTSIKINQSIRFDAKNLNDS